MAKKSKEEKRSLKFIRTCYDIIQTQQKIDKSNLDLYAYDDIDEKYRIRYNNSSDILELVTNDEHEYVISRSYDLSPRCIAELLVAYLYEIE